MTRKQISRVAVIGAGISGVVSAGHLLEAGIDLVVFERSQAAGGVWLHDERQPLEPNYPSTKPSVAEEPNKAIPSSQSKLLLEHAPPGPCYDSLKNNVSTPLMRVKLNAWPKGTPDFVSHTVLRDYIQDTSDKAGVEDVTVYGARVTNVQKCGDSWEVRWSRLRQTDGVFEEYQENSAFDAVVVASGHYHAARVPDIPALVEVKARWPRRIIHSKGYRKPDVYRDKNVLLIGGGVSSIDIARDIGPFTKNVFQSTRNGELDITSNLLPDNGVRVSEISSFEIQEGVKVETDDPLPLFVHLKSGERLCDIDNIIICTGYHITLPFLSQYHDDDTAPGDANDSILVTDGTQVHNLHKDIFYIPDPTLAFVGIPYYTATFSLFEFQAIAVAAVFSGKASLPGNMRLEYQQKLELLGSGRKFHSLKDMEEGYVQELMEWVNASRAGLGLPKIEGHTSTWHEAKAAQAERIKVLFASDQRRDSGVEEISGVGNCI